MPRVKGSLVRTATSRLGRHLVGPLALAAVALTACSAGSAGGPASSAGGSGWHPTATSTATAASPGPSTSPTRQPSGHLNPPRVAGITWVPEGQRVHGVPATYVARLAGGRISLLWMDPTLLRFRYIPGTTYPEGSPVRAVDRTPATWVSQLVAAFNGGFELKSSAGGYYYAGTLVRAMRPGLAAMEITADGRLRVGVWGRDLALTASTEVVRENLRPLVDRHVSRASPSDSSSAWGLANGSLIHANRSALGQLDDGSLVFAYGSEVRAWQMGAALVQVRAAEAVMLDMNKSWPGGFTYTHIGGKVTGRRIHPSMYHSGSVYLTRFTKDFVVAEAAP